MNANDGLADLEISCGPRLRHRGRRTTRTSSAPSRSTARAARTRRRESLARSSCRRRRSRWAADDGTAVISIYCPRHVRGGRCKGRIEIDSPPGPVRGRRAGKRRAGVRARVVAIRAGGPQARTDPGRPLARGPGAREGAQGRAGRGDRNRRLPRLRRPPPRRNHHAASPRRRLSALALARPEPHRIAPPRRPRGVSRP